MLGGARKRRGKRASLLTLLYRLEPAPVTWRLSWKEGKRWGPRTPSSNAGRQLQERATLGGREIRGGEIHMTSPLTELGQRE